MENFIKNGVWDLTALQFELKELRTQLAAVEAERDAARAGEARAVEALREVAAVTNQLGPDKASGQYMAESAHKIASTFLTDSQPALDWLAQQRAEAAAAEAERTAGECHSLPTLRQIFLNRAAALRAGKGVGDA